MRTRLIISVLAVLASLLVVAPFAQAAAECGATEEQWIGGFDGSHVDRPGPLPLSIEVTRNAEGTLGVETEVNGAIYPTTYVEIVLKRLTWTVLLPPNPLFPSRHYAPDFGEVTCSGGIVTSFTGYALDYMLGYGEVWFSDIELVRVN